MRSMFFWLPMTSLLLILWLLLANEVSVGQVLVGFIIGFLLMIFSLRMRPDLAYPRKPLVTLKLIAIVIYDVIKSNILVAKLVLYPRRYELSSGYVYIPLDIRDPHGLAILGCIVTFTPGTVWSGLTEKDYILRLHVLDLKDEAEWFRTIKNRYEKNLMEIFE